jgi:hypothetical protein
MITYTHTPSFLNTNTFKIFSFNLFPKIPCEESQCNDDDDDVGNKTYKFYIPIWKWNSIPNVRKTHVFWSSSRAANPALFCLPC